MKQYLKQYFTKGWIVGMVVSLAVASLGVPTFAAEKGKTTPYSNDACAFMDTATGKCVVGFVCKYENTDLCNVVIEYLKSRKLLDTRAADELVRARPARVCDDSPILCTCCDVRNGCYPCPKK